MPLPDVVVLLASFPSVGIQASVLSQKFVHKLP
jgi:hypothetical protein